MKWTISREQERGEMVFARLVVDGVGTGQVFAKPAELDDLERCFGQREDVAGEERNAIRVELGAKETESTLGAAVRLRAELKAAHEANIVLRGKAVDAATARVVDLAAAIRAVPLELLSKGLSDAFTAEIERTRDAKGFEGAVAALASRHFAAVEGVREAIIAGLVPSLEEVAAAAEQLSPPIDASFDEEEAAEPVDASDEKHPTPCACDVGHPEMCPHALDEAPRWVREALKDQEQSLQGFRGQDMKAVAMTARFAIDRLESTGKYIDALFGSAHALKADACQPMLEAITVLGVLVKAGDDFSALADARRRVREDEARRERDAARVPKPSSVPEPVLALMRAVRAYADAKGDSLNFGAPSEAEREPLLALVTMIDGAEAAVGELGAEAEAVDEEPGPAPYTAERFEPRDGAMPPTPDTISRQVAWLTRVANANGAT